MALGYIFPTVKLHSWILYWLEVYRSHSRYLGMFFHCKTTFLYIIWTGSLSLPQSTLGYIFHFKTTFLDIIWTGCLSLSQSTLGYVFSLSHYIPLSHIARKFVALTVETWLCFFTVKLNSWLLYWVESYCSHSWQLGKCFSLYNCIPGYHILWTFVAHTFDSWVSFFTSQLHSWISYRLDVCCSHSLNLVCLFSLKLHFWISYFL